MFFSSLIWCYGHEDFIRYKTTESLICLPKYGKNTAPGREILLMLSMKMKSLPIVLVVTQHFVSKRFDKAQEKDVRKNGKTLILRNTTTEGVPRTCVICTLTLSHLFALIFL